jgi:hypothetical protein
MTAVLGLAALAASSVAYRRVRDELPTEIHVGHSYDAKHVFGAGTVGVQQYAFYADGGMSAGVFYITSRGFVL